MNYLKLIKKYKICLIFIFQFLLYIIIQKYNPFNDISDKNHSNSPSSPLKYNEHIINNLNKNNKKTVLLKGRMFLDKCLNGSNNKTYKANDNPSITVIIPSFNCEKTIVSSINSVQYQNFTNIEIIIIDDFSIDSTKNIIDNIRINDKRIKFIQNNKNMGTLYSRCIGALLSQGSYILSLDNDDLFFDEDVFDFLYKKIKNDDLDIVSFRALSFSNYFDKISAMKDYRFYGFKNNLFLSQHQLGIFPISFKKKFFIHDNEIWSKIIKSKVYKKAVELLGIERYRKYVCWAEDTNINFIVFNIASSFKYSHKYGYIHIYRKTSATFVQKINNKLFGELFFLDVMFDFLKNTSVKNYAASYALKIRKKYFLKYSIIKENKKYLKSILSKIIKSRYITAKKKKKLKFYFRNILHKK